MLRKAAYTHRVVSCSKSDPRADYYAQNIRHEDVVFFRSGQVKAALAKTVDHLFGTSFQNEQQFNEGRVVTQDGFRFRLRQDDIAEVIGYSGNTGNSTGPHLHFGIIENNSWIDPLNYLTGWQYYG